KGIQGNCSLVDAELRLLRDDTATTEAQIEDLLRRLSGTMGFAREQAGQAPGNMRTRLRARVKDSARLHAARTRLIEAGAAEAIVQKFSPTQVILLNEKHQFLAQRDERTKLLALAPWQIDSLVGTTEKANADDNLFADFLPRVVEARRAQCRLEQQIALLRH